MFRHCCLCIIRPQLISGARYLRGSRRIISEVPNEQQDRIAENRHQDESTFSNAEKLFRDAALFQDDIRKHEDEVSWSSSAYPVRVPRPARDQSMVKPTVAPETTSVILFPGQGSQFVGMGRNLLNVPNVDKMYKVASDILGYDLLQLCLEGPKTELDKTIYCQPAVMVTSLAAVEKLKYERPEAVKSCFSTAGFSVGELTALVFAGAFSFEDGVHLVKARAEAMQAASELHPSGMTTVFFGADNKVNLACEAARKWCERKNIENADCRVANYLFSGCKVIAGSEEALQFITLNAKDFGIRRWKRLPVSGAFHTSLMNPAREVLRESLKLINISNPLIAVHSNVDGKRYQDPEHIRKQLPRQICKPLLWEQVLHQIYKRDIDQSYPQTFECGPGNTLQVILKQVNGKAYANMQNVPA